MLEAVVAALGYTTPVAAQPGDRGGAGVSVLTVVNADACGRLAALSLLTELDAFFADHRPVRRAGRRPR
jgi:hypothetical protein